MPATIRIDFEMHTEAISKALQAEFTKVQSITQAANNVIEQSRSASTKRIVANSIQEEQRGIANIQALKHKAEQEVAQMRSAFSAKTWGSEKEAATRIVAEIKTLQERKDVLVRTLQLENISKVEKEEINAEKRKVDRALGTMRRIALENTQIAQKGAGAEVGIMGQQRNIENIKKGFSGIGQIATVAALGVAVFNDEIGEAIGQGAQYVSTAAMFASGVGGVSKAFLSAEKAQKLLNLAMAAAPWALAAAGVVALVLAINELTGSQEEAAAAAKKHNLELQKQADQKFFQTLGEDVENMRKEYALLAVSVNGYSGAEKQAMLNRMEYLKDQAAISQRALNQGKRTIEEFDQAIGASQVKQEEKRTAHVRRAVAIEQKANDEILDSHVKLYEDITAARQKYEDELQAKLSARIEIAREVNRIESELEAEHAQNMQDRLTARVDALRFAAAEEIRLAEEKKRAEEKASDELQKQIELYAQAALSVFSLIGAIKDLSKEEHKRDEAADERLQKQLEAHEQMTESNAGLAKDDKQAQAIRRQGEEQRSQMLAQRNAEEEAAMQAGEERARRQNTANLIQTASTMTLAIAKAIQESLNFGLAALVVGPALVAFVISLFQSSKSGLGFRKGGYTGDGREDEEAGVVHKKEFVLPAGSFARDSQGKIIHIDPQLIGGSSGEPMPSIRLGAFLGAHDDNGGPMPSIRPGVFLGIREDLQENNKLLRQVIANQNKGRSRSRMMEARSLNRESV